MPTRRAVPAALAALVLGAALAVAACGEEVPAGSTGEETPGAGVAPIERDPANEGVEITIGSKDSTEQKVLAEIIARGLRAAGYTVDTELGRGDEEATLEALQEGRIDAYPEYTAAALLSFGTEAAEIPTDPRDAFELARAEFAERGLVALPPTPFTSSYEVALTEEKAQELGVIKISDLAGVADQLTLYGPPECRRRLDCLLGLQQVYGLEFEEFVPIDTAQRHTVLASGRADLSIVSTTDPQVEREGFVLLDDDLRMFPPYNSTLVMREETAEEAGPRLAVTTDRIQADLTDEAMQELNARVDLDGRTPAEVAEQYLTETGLVKD